MPPTPKLPASPPPFPPAFLVAFVLGGLLIHAGRAHARATTILLSAAAPALCLTVGGLPCDRLGPPSGSAEAGDLFRPRTVGRGGDGQRR